MKKKIAVLGLLMLITAPLFADYNKKIKELQYEKEELQSYYERKEKELQDITMKIHEIDTELAELINGGQTKKSY